jgi:hypothetical protein
MLRAIWGSFDAPKITTTPTIATMTHSFMCSHLPGGCDKDSRPQTRGDGDVTTSP